MLALKPSPVHLDMRLVFPTSESPSIRSFTLRSGGDVASGMADNIADGEDGPSPQPGPASNTFMGSPMLMVSRVVSTPWWLVSLTLPIFLSYSSSTSRSESRLTSPFTISDSRPSRNARCSLAVKAPVRCEGGEEDPEEGAEDDVNWGGRADFRPEDTSVSEKKLLLLLLSSISLSTSSKLQSTSSSPPSITPPPTIGVPTMGVPAIGVPPFAVGGPSAGGRPDATSRNASGLAGPPPSP
mmetsp:Transcript_21202/g.44244  ORF Transcript_21202/g.44244 Transcript_21202/m.44244 type:complete len:240 (+) Transcript_21202:619-1338(+)